MAIDAPEVDFTDDPQRFEEATKAFRARVPMTDDEWDALEAAEREFAFKVSNVAQADMVAQVWEALAAAIENGETLDDFGARVGDLLTQSWGGADPGLLENIFRTNGLQAYSAGRHEIFTAPTVKRARPYWRFDAIKDDRTTEICAECDGVIVAQDDRWWDDHVPGLHFQCRSHVTALSEKEAQREGITRHPPAIKAMEGFGRRPTNAGRDWTPDLLGYPKEIASELADRIEEPA